MHYNVIIIGGGPGGIFSAYELTKDRSDLRVAVFDTGHSLESATAPSTATRSNPASAARAARS